MIVIKDKMFWLLEALSWAGGFVKAFLKPILNSSDSEKLTRIVKKTSRYRFEVLLADCFLSCSAIMPFMSNSNINTLLYTLHAITININGSGNGNSETCHFGSCGRLQRLSLTTYWKKNIMRV